MKAMVDVIGSFILGGMILVMSTKLNFAISQNSQQANFGLETQENCVVVSKILDNDFGKIGHGAKLATPITISDSSKIRVFGDMDNNGTIDSVTYYTGLLPAGTGTYNTKHKLLYRVQNGKTVAMNVGLTKFNVTYFDSSGNKTTTPANVRAFNVAMELESLVPTTDTMFSVVHWEQYFRPKMYIYTFN
jgi:hypothetical protein